MSLLVDQYGNELTAIPHNVDPSIEKAVREITAEFFENVKSNEEALSKSYKGASNEPKAWFADPFNLLDSIGMGYRASPTYLTYDTLRVMTERDTVIAAIILTRINQVATFARPQENKYSVGFKVRPRSRTARQRRPSDSERRRMEEIEMFLLNTGRDYNPNRDSFETFLRKFVRDRLSYDQTCFEKVRSYDGRPHSFLMVPSDSIRVANPTNEKGTPPDVAEIKNSIRYIQMLNAQIVTEFTGDELAFCVANPRTAIKTYGYGLPETELLMTTVTAHMWAEEWNRRAFSQGSTVKGILNLKGNMSLQQLEAFKRQWSAQVAGVSNAWKTPVVNTDGIDWMPLQLSNTEMGYQMWMEYLVKVATAIFQIDPAEINFDLRGGVGQQPVFMSTNEAQQKQSKDRGLQPLLRFVEDAINRHVVWEIDPRFELCFAGLDAKTEEQVAQLRMQQVQNTHTLNESRALEDLPPVENGDVVLNPTWTGYLTQKEAMQQQQSMMGGQGGPPGAGGPQQPDPNEMRMMGGQPGEAEKNGAAALQGAFGSDESDDGKKRKVDDMDDDERRYYLHVNDWESTVHSSMPEGDLFKSLFDTVEID